MTATHSIPTPTILRLITTVIVLMIGVPGVHAAQAYDVELVLFKYSHEEYFSGENWQKEWIIPDTTGALDLNRVPGEYRGKIRRLNSGERSLSAIADSLDESSRYEVLTYEAWRQPGLNKDNAAAILIQAGDRYSKQSRTLTLEDEHSARGTLFLRPGEISDQAGANGNASTPPDSQQPLTESYQRVDEASRIPREDVTYELEGTVKVVLSRFLHVYTDLLLMQPVMLEPLERQTLEQAEPAGSVAPKPASQGSEPVQRYRVTPVDDNQAFTTLQGIDIRQHRRMRSGELHHLDHPLLGTLVKVTPVEE